MQKPTRSTFKDIEGARFGRWKVLNFAGSDNGSLWKCQCDCGTVCIVSSSGLRQGSKSCGCLQKESARITGLTLYKRRKAFPSPTKTHGLSKSKTYAAWNQMIQRCHNPKNHTYERYGAKGITVCDRWRKSFENFLADMGEAPSPDHTLDRKNNHQGYKKSNCRWLLGNLQARNRKYVKLYQLGKESLTAKEIAQRCGIRVATIKVRLDNGWSVEKAMTTNPDDYHKRRST